MQSRVSIVVPSYNHARFLGPALDGVLAQTFGGWELLLVDDCSSDDSVSVARGFDDPRIRVVANERNLGTYGTQQRALEQTAGEYVAILNSDDLWQPTKLQAQVDALDASPECGFCYALGWKVDAEGVVDHSEDVHGDWPTTERQELLPFLLDRNRVLASAVMFRRERLRFETSCRYSGDWVALLEAAWRGPCACVSERLCYWRVHGANTFTASQPQLIEEVRVREAVARSGAWIVPRLDLAGVRRGLAQNAMNLLALYALVLDGRAARRAGIAALRLHPDQRAVAKRALAAFLPVRRLRAHLWAGKLDGAQIDADAARAAIHRQPPLELRVGGGEVVSK